ncbi:MAG: oxidative damage protection protein [Gemmatimonadota bacterium]|nr:oxidative damage protection protein [Gemmatimonadota bacterium]
MATITCARCGLDKHKQPFQLFQNDLGRRAFETICVDCWGEWLKHQQALINHYALNLREPKSKTFLFEQMEQFLFTSAAQS